MAAAGPPVVLPFDSPVLHMKGLELAQVKGTCSRSPREERWQDSSPGSAELSLSTYPSSAHHRDKPGADSEETGYGGSGNLNSTAFVLHPKPR